MKTRSRSMVSAAIALAVTLVALPLFGQSPDNAGQTAASSSSVAVGSLLPLGFNTPLSVTGKSKGQVFNFSFNGKARQTVSLTETNNVRPCSILTLSIARPDGSTFASKSTCGSTSLSNVILPMTGVYSVVLNPGATSGPVTLTLTTKITQPLGLDTPKEISSRNAGQLFDLIFDGKSGQRVSVNVTKNSYPCEAMSFTLLKPDGKTLALAKHVCGNSALGRELLPATGTYTIRVDPDIASGGATFTVSTASH